MARIGSGSKKAHKKTAAAKSGRPAQKVLRVAAERKTENKGICATCVNIETCTFPRDAQKPLLECDEFDGGKQMPIMSVAEFIGAVRARSSGPRVEKKGQEEFKGLCVNCEIRQTCTFPRPEEGVWHCEEYV